MVKFKHLFHGTSSVYRNSIRELGLLPKGGRLHLTTHPLVALVEALRTVRGEDDLTGGYKEAVGGSPLVVLVERLAAANLKIDVPGYYEKDDRAGYRPSELRFAFVMDGRVPPPALSFVEGDPEIYCKRMLDEIDAMTVRPVFRLAIKCDLGRLRVYRT